MIMWLKTGVLMVALAVALPAAARQASASASASASSAPAKPLDRSGKTRTGKASYYGPGLEGASMANGKPMNPDGKGAASKTLPLGTKARVTNLETGKSDTVVIEDRGPYVKGRIIDVSPQTAKKLDLKEDGVAPVAVKPIELPDKNK
jgi:rare lipoprotein A